MAVKIRLARHGAKKRPFYHIVVADVRAPRDGRYIERIGHYNPMVPKEHKERLVIQAERVKHWLGVGALPTDRVARFLGEQGLMEKFKYTETPQKSQPKAKAVERVKEREEKAQKAKEAAEAPKPKVEEPVEVPVEVAAEVAQEEPAEVPAEEPAEAPVEVPEAPAEVPAETPAEVPAEAPEEKAAE
jgi:small subunit ribosomal protein S16